MNRICRHCSKCKVNRPRGLCWSCYYTPGILARYPSANTFGRGLGKGSDAPSLPTTAAPGTSDKVAVLEERAKLRQPLFHPADAMFEGDPRPLEFLRAELVPQLAAA